MTTRSSSTLRAVTPSPTEALRAKFVTLGQVLRTEVLEADERIDGALTALVAGQHMAMIGPPGTAKTYLVLRLWKRITGSRNYQELMRKTMTPELVYGSQSILAMKNDEPVRFIIEGMIPDSDMALLDEFPRTSDAILNGLLMILNEGIFKNGSTLIECPLSTAFLCANSLPTGEVEHDLEAFWDRVVMRFYVEQPVDRETWRALARMRPDPNPEPILDWSDVLAAKDQARALPITDECIDAIDEIRVRLHSESIQMTGRRMAQAQFVCAAWAWLQGADEVRAEHGEMLAHMLWDTPDQRGAVDRIVAEVVSPALRQAVAITDAIQEFDEKMGELLITEPKTGKVIVDPARTPEVNELFAKMVAQREELDAFVPTVTGRALRTAEAADRQLDAMQQRLVGSMGVDLKSLRGLRS